MDQDTMDAVNEVVEDLTAKGELFSCFDVTRQLRDEKSLKVFHSEVRKQVHALYGNLAMPVDYERDDVALPNGRTTCVFHPRAKSLTEYDPDKFGSVNDPFGATKTLTQTIQGLGRASRAQTAAPSQTDRRGRFCISNKMTRQVGMTHGNRVNIVCNSQYNYMQISPANVAPYSAGTTVFNMKIDKDDNLRISKSMLREAGLLGKVLTVRLEGSTIVVE